MKKGVLLFSVIFSPFTWIQLILLTDSYLPLPFRRFDSMAMHLFLYSGKNCIGQAIAITKSLHMA